MMAPVQQRSRSLSLLVFAVLAVLAGCGGNRTLVAVTVSGLTDGVTSLLIKDDLSGYKQEQFSVVQDLGTFSVLLPDGAQGQFSLTVRALKEGGCSIATGSGQVRVSGETQVALPIPLSPQSPAMCPLIVTQTGPGTVRSQPPGIDCGSTCEASFPEGTLVALSPTAADASSYFAGFTGACDGMGRCGMLLDRSAQVGAGFAPKVCTSQDFCWEHPLPQGNPLNRVWGSSSRDVWATSSNGNLFHFDGTTWTPYSTGSDQFLYGIWGSAADDVWAVGNGATLLHKQGNTWTATTIGKGNLRSIWGSSAHDIWVGGTAGLLFHYDGSNWTPVTLAATSPTPPDVLHIWGSDAKNVWAVGRYRAGKTFAGIVLHLINGQWADVTAQIGATLPSLNGVWGTSTQDVWIVGSTGTVLHFDGKWTDLSSASATKANLLRGWSSAPGDVWIVGSGLSDLPGSGVILHYDGTRFYPVMGTPQDVNGIWGSRHDDVWAVGDGGTLLHLSGSGWNWWSSADGHDLNGVWGGGAGAFYAAGKRGLLLHWDGAAVSRVPTGTTGDLYGVFGSGGGDLWAVGDGTILHAPDGQHVSSEAPASTPALRGVWGSGPGDLWAVGQGGTDVLRRQGTPDWAPSPLTPGYDLLGVSGSGPQDVWLVGETADCTGAVVHYTGTFSSAVPDPAPAAPLHGVYSTGTNVWAVGEQGTLGQLDPATLKWTDVPWPGDPDAQPDTTLSTVWGHGPADVWAAGGDDGGAVLFHWDGKQWTPQPTGIGNALSGVYETAKGGLWLIGSAGTIVRYQPK